jgi:hypothetical protein
MMASTKNTWATRSQSRRARLNIGILARGHSRNKCGFESEETRSSDSDGDSTASTTLTRCHSIASVVNPSIGHSFSSLSSPPESLRSDLLSSAVRRLSVSLDALGTILE